MALLATHKGTFAYTLETRLQAFPHIAPHKRIEKKQRPRNRFYNKKKNLAVIH
jgi:hypothetical protein